MSKQLTPERRAARAVARQAASRESARHRHAHGRPLAAVLAVVVVVALAVTGIALAHHGGGSRHTASSDNPVPDPTPTTAAGRWRAGVLSDFKPMDAVLVRLLQTLQGWGNGTVPAATARLELQDALPAVVATSTALQGRAAFPQAPFALSDYRAAARLYQASFRVELVATELPAGALQTQAVLTATRLRTLGDRAFDQANAELEPFDPRERTVDGVIVRKPAEVPDWRSIKLAAGPPLDVQPAPTAPRSYQTTRPTSAASTWVEAVAALGVPSGSSERAVLLFGTASQLRDLARALVAASDGVHALPDPEGKRLDSTRVQLALLVHADAARTAQLATFVSATLRTALDSVARDVAIVGDTLWSPLLPARTTAITPQR